MSDAFALGDAAALARAARRTLVVRALLAAGAVAAAAVALTAALRDPPAAANVLAAGSAGIVVLDVSASISAETYRRIALTLDRLAASRGRYGLVLFSDTAYLTLPPGTPARELRLVARFFRVPPRAGAVLATPPASPWAEPFSAGTRISTGLAVALETIRRERLGAPAVLLVSDLDNDARDVEPLARVALEYRRSGIPLHVVALDPAPEDRRTVESLLTRRDRVVVAPDPREPGTFAAPARDRTLIVAAGAAALLLALLLALTERLRWRVA